MKLISCLYTRGMISDKVRRHFVVDCADKYKNQNSSDDPRHAKTKPTEEIMSLVAAAGKHIYQFVIADPPYTTQNAGHTAANCDLTASDSFMKKNARYGVVYPYKVVERSIVANGRRLIGGEIAHHRERRRISVNICGLFRVR